MLPPFLAFVYIICAGCIAQLRQQEPETLSGIGAADLGDVGLANSHCIGVCCGDLHLWYFRLLVCDAEWPDRSIKLVCTTKIVFRVDVIKRQIACFPSRGGGRNAAFRLELQDGQEIDIADTQQAEFAKHFAQLAMLTHAAPVVVNDIGDGRYCPSVILNVLAEHRP